MAITPAGSVYGPFAVPQVIGPTSLLTTTLADEALAGFLGDSTTVELSGLGQLLSATEIFQNTLANLQPGSTTSGLGENFGNDMASLAAEVQNFVDAFNTVQQNLANLTQPFGVLGGEPLAAQFSQTLNNLVTSPLADTGSGPTSLAELGITLQSSSTGGTVSIDLNALQSAYEANPGGTFAALSQATRLFGSAAASFASLASSETAAEASFAPFGFGQTTSATTGLFDLLALSSFNSGVATTFTQQLMALNEFNLVSTLLG